MFVVHTPPNCPPSPKAAPTLRRRRGMCQPPEGTKQEAAIGVHVSEHVYMCNTHSNMLTINREWYWQSCTLEAWHIPSEQHRLRTDDEDPLPAEYNTIIHLLHPSILH